MDITRPTVMEVSIDNFLYNIERIKEKCPNSKIMPVIKANAYGTYLNTRLDVLNRFDIVAVACVDEAVYIRELGYEKEIFVLNQPYETEIDKIIKYNIVVGVSSYHFLDKLAETNKEVHIHIEIGTGMGRTGVHPYRLEKFINSIKSNIVVDGIYTHLSSADIDLEYTKNQIKSFNIAVDTAKRMLGKLKYIHANASNGILNFPESNFNLVRPGIIMYGYKSSDDTFDKIDLKPVASLKSKISFLKEVEEGTSIGYSRSYITDRTLTLLPRSMREKYETFMQEGSLIVMPGTVLDMMQVYEDLEQHYLTKGYDIRAFGFDPYNAKEFVNRWITENGEYGVEKVIQGSKTESVPLGELKHMAEDRLLLFDEALMTFAMGNCIVLEDTNGNRKLYKKRYDHKIDNVAAMLDAYVAYKLNVESFE